MSWKNINCSSIISDVVDSWCLFSFPYGADHIQNWRELGREGAGICCYRHRVPEPEYARFEMLGKAFGKNYDLILRKNRLEREIYSTKHHPKGKKAKLSLWGDPAIKAEFEDFNILVLMKKRVGYGDIDDFMAMAQHALKRIPCIAEELLMGDVEDYRTGGKGGFWSMNRKLVMQRYGDHRYLQHKASNQFYDLFCATALNSPNISSDESRSLVELVGSLKVEEPHDPNVVLW